MQTFWLGSRLGFWFGSWVWTQSQTPQKINLGLDSEFNSLHFGIEINKCLKFLGPKMCDKFETS